MMEKNSKDQIATRSYYSFEGILKGTLGLEKANVKYEIKHSSSYPYNSFVLRLFKENPCFFAGSPFHQKPDNILIIK